MLQSDGLGLTAERRAAWGSANLALVTIALAAVLMLPAIYNGFPLVFPDTSAYLAVAYADSWPIDRAGFYGLILSPALLSMDPSAGLWLAILGQSLIISAVLLAVARRLMLGARPLPTFVLLALIAIATTLPWHASQLMPDAFTGAAILLVWLTSTRNVADRGTPLLWLGTAVLALVHYTHVGVVAAGSATTILLCASAGVPWKEIAKRAVAAALTIAAVLAAHTAVHGVYFGRWQASPLGGYFLFARLHEDGLVQPWMDRHCGDDAPKPLCDIRGSIPSDSQDLLWGKRPSPLYERINKKAGEPESWRWVDMVTEAAIGSLKEQPVTFAANAFRATADQFAHYRALDDECPENCRNLKMFEWRPSLTQPVRASRQLTRDLPRRAIQAVTSTTSTAGLILLLPLFILAFRKRDFPAQSLVATITVCLVVNAAMAGALSDVHDRYQSRVVWLAPLAAILILFRWRAAVSPRG